MKIVISIDSFKGSLTSMEAGEAFRDGSIKAAPDADVVVKPLADGGEGTAEALVEGMGGVWIRTEVSGPQKERREISYGWFPENRLAVMEMAAAAGLTLLPEGERNALYTTTYGVGEMIRDALERGARQFLLGIGGSATNDCGLGMMTALGIKFLDAGGKEAGITGEDTGRVRKIDCSGLIPQLRECRFQVACDVTNVLCGSQGATYVYGPQKGIPSDQLSFMDDCHKNFARCTEEAVGEDFSCRPGAGAAGGLGLSLMAFLGAELLPGAELVMRTLGIEKEIAGADLVITGEGRIDGQTSMGKGPMGIARIARKYRVPVIGIGGSVTKEAETAMEPEMDALFSVLREPLTLKEAMEPERAKENLRRTGEQIVRMVRTFENGSRRRSEITK
ncbi:MAG TPA: glycerate kinase [Candidatus Choladousia intestinavium]|uniref:Glycerate kinase n=1 Tax=Candidatus Choladousia intestinavium TaxID=2840727 RepID=A0A9D1ABL8_9FIRM|nr:glycerate kinase [Candidatus Choladousia intestinavium]